MMTPSLTTTAPTAGLGQVRPSPRRPSASASRMKRLSSALSVGSAMSNVFNSPLLSGDRTPVIPSAQPHGASMLISGKEKLERMRDGRAVYIGAERVDDVTTPSGVPRRRARPSPASTISRPIRQQRELFSFEEDGERISLLLAALPHPRRSRAAHARVQGDRRRDLRLRSAARPTRCRGPDHRAGDEPGAARRLARRASAQNLLHYYDFARKNDLYLSFAVTPASGRKSADLFPGQQRDDPNLQVVAEDDAGVTVSGHEDAGHQRGLCRRNPDRQPHADRRQAQERGDHRGAAAQRAGPVAVVAPALRAARRATRPTIRCRTASTRPTACWSATA